MLEHTSQEFRKFFLLKFTQALIRNSGKSDLFKLETLIKEKTEEKKEKEENPLTNQDIKEKIRQKFNPFPKLENLEKGFLVNSLPPTKNSFKKFKPIPIVKIPEVKLPPNLQYLRPIPIKVEIDLEKLNPLINDFQVHSIECNGADENLVVKGLMGTKKTGIILSNYEIDDIISKFSSESNIPINEGISKIVVGDLVLSAIISEVIGSKFIIRKILPSFGMSRRF